MISLLQLLHVIAAERGDGIHPELRKRLPTIDSNKFAAQAEADADRTAGDPTPPWP